MKKMLKIMPKPDVITAVDLFNIVGTSSDAVIFYSAPVQEQVIRSCEMLESST
jgi:hypothetical protein